MGFFSLQTTKFMHVFIMRDMQLLGACANNFLLFQSAMTRVVALLQPRLDGTFMASRLVLFEIVLFFF